MTFHRGQLEVGRPGRGRECLLPSLSLLPGAPMGQGQGEARGLRRPERLTAQRAGLRKAGRSSGKGKLRCYAQTLYLFSFESTAPGLSAQQFDYEVVFGISLALFPYLCSSHAPAYFQFPQERNGLYLFEVP